jgi:hypothetical protein
MKKAGIALDCGPDDQVFKSWQGLGIFLFTTVSRLALEPTQLPVQWATGALSLGAKQPGHEADHQPTHLVLRSKNKWRCTTTPPICLHGVMLD